MKAKILLINPWIYDFAAYDFWNKPLGLLYLASLLRENGAEVFFVDCLDPYHPDMQKTGIFPPRRKESGKGSYFRQIISKPPPLKGIPRHYHRYGMTPDVFLKSVLSLPRPDLIMMTSMMTYWYPAVFEMVLLLHQTFPGIPVILGGNYVTLMPSHASQSGADFCLAGPAELSIPSLLKNVFQLEMDSLPNPSNLDSYPYPAFDLIRHPDHVPIMTSRGCLYHCNYCASHLINDNFRRRDPIYVVNEIEYWHDRLGIKHFSFYDDALLVDPYAMIIPFLKEVIKRHLPVQFHCPNGLHIREMNADLSILMFKAGFRTIRFGFETSNELRQISSGGKVYNAEFIDAVAHLKRAGYQREDIGVYLLCGLPGQSAEEVNESIRFVQSCGARPIIAEYSPIPGTGLWKEAIASSIYPIEAEPLFQNNSLLPCRNASLTYKMYQRLKLMTKKSYGDLFDTT